jgi:hypothetical protein
LVLVLGMFARTARADPAGTRTADPEGAEALRIDLERIVTTAEAGGWYVDSSAYADLHPVLLESVCKASLEARSAALEAVRQSAQRAGDPRRVFAEEGRQRTARFDTALTLDRMQRALERALARADEDCPFWELPRRGFQSRQTDYRKLTLSLETGGNIQLRQTAGSWTFGGGGLGRILPGYGFGPHTSVLIGVEFGGGAMLRPGSPETEFVVNYFPAIPVVLRYRHVNWRYDLEVGAVGLFQADNTRLSYGGRVGTSIGVFATRTRNLLPWAGVGGTYEYYVASGGRPAAHFIRGGLRVGLLWDL